MNETNLIPRQKAILNLINLSTGLSREQIGTKISVMYTVSKPTLVRDLRTLLQHNLVRLTGKGKNTVYFPREQNPLLRYIDLSLYFQEEPDTRVGAKTTFDFGIFDHVSHLITESESEAIRAVQKSFSQQSKRLSRDVVTKELERFVIELSWKSSKIEGNTYTLLETERLIRESKQAPGKSKEEAIMILNHKATFDHMLIHKGDFRLLTISAINQLHNSLVKDMGIQTGIRTRAVGITGTVYQPLDNQHQLREAMERVIHAINSNTSPLEKSLIALSLISYIQPYTDGNKRTARMLTNAILLAHDYCPISYRSVDEDEFKQSLILFYEQGSMFHLKRLFLNQLLFAYATYFR